MGYWSGFTAGHMPSLDETGAQSFHAIGTFLQIGRDKPSGILVCAIREACAVHVATAY
jgi:hypothetical protein